MNMTRRNILLGGALAPLPFAHAAPPHWQKLGPTETLTPGDYLVRGDPNEIHSALSGTGARIVHFEMHPVNGAALGVQVRAATGVYGERLGSPVVGSEYAFWRPVRVS